MFSYTINTNSGWEYTGSQPCIGWNQWLATCEILASTLGLSRIYECFEAGWGVCVLYRPVFLRLAHFRDTGLSIIARWMLWASSKALTGTDGCLASPPLWGCSESHAPPSGHELWEQVPFISFSSEQCCWCCSLSCLTWLLAADICTALTAPLQFSQLEKRLSSVTLALECHPCLEPTDSHLHAHW